MYLHTNGSECNFGYGIREHQKDIKSSAKKLLIKKIKRAVAINQSLCSMYILNTIKYGWQQTTYINNR